MTRSSEKLAGDWEARIAANTQPIAGGKLVRHALLVVALVVTSWSAIFGFR
jgi:hypothetical protein